MKKGDTIKFGGDRNWGQYEGEILGKIIMPEEYTQYLDPEEIYQVKITKLIDNKYDFKTGIIVNISGGFGSPFSIDPYLKDDMEEWGYEMEE